MPVCPVTRRVNPPVERDVADLDVARVSGIEPDRPTDVEQALQAAIIRDRGLRRITRRERDQKTGQSAVKELCDDRL
jgi:hypothetical protein